MAVMADHSFGWPFLIKVGLKFYYICKIRGSLCVWHVSMLAKGHRTRAMQAGFFPGYIYGQAGGHSLGGVCGHINHFGYHIKEISMLKAWGATTLKGPRENTAT